MQFLAGLVLDCIGVVLKPIDVPLEQLVFSLQVMELAIQRSRILAFLLVHSEPILSEDDVIAHRNRKNSRSSGSDPSPARLGAAIQTHDDGGPTPIRACCD